MNYINQYGTYPPNPDSYRSAVMMGVKRLKDTLESGMHTGAFTVRQLSVSSVTDTHNAFQFAAVGDRPPLYDREVLFISPIQRAAKSWVIPYYVQTRNMPAAYTPKIFTFTISGFTGVSASSPAQVSCLDPMTGASVPVEVSHPAQDTMSFRVAATDYPRLLQVVEP